MSGDSRDTWRRDPRSSDRRLYHRRERSRSRDRGDRSRRNHHSRGDSMLTQKSPTKRIVRVVRKRIRPKTPSQRAAAPSLNPVKLVVSTLEDTKTAETAREHSGKPINTAKAKSLEKPSHAASEKAAISQGIPANAATVPARTVSVPLRPVGQLSALMIGADSSSSDLSSDEDMPDRPKSRFGSFAKPSGSQSSETKSSETKTETARKPEAKDAIEDESSNSDSSSSSDDEPLLQKPQSTAKLPSKALQSSKSGEALAKHRVPTPSVLKQVVPKQVFSRQVPSQQVPSQQVPPQQVPSDQVAPKQEVSLSTASGQVVSQPSPARHDPSKQSTSETSTAEANGDSANESSENSPVPSRDTEDSRGVRPSGSTHFSAEQLTAMQATLNKSDSPTSAQVASLAHELSLPLSSLSRWFNRQKRLRKQRVIEETRRAAMAAGIAVDMPPRLRRRRRDAYTTPSSSSDSSDGEFLLRKSEPPAKRRRIVSPAESSESSDSDEELLEERTWTRQEDEALKKAFRAYHNAVPHLWKHALSSKGLLSHLQRTNTQCARRWQQLRRNGDADVLRLIGDMPEKKKEEQPRRLRQWTAEQDEELLCGMRQFAHRSERWKLIERHTALGKQFERTAKQIQSHWKVLESRGEVKEAEFVREARHKEELQRSERNAQEDADQATEKVTDKVTKKVTDMVNKKVTDRNTDRDTERGAREDTRAVTRDDTKADVKPWRGTPEQVLRQVMSTASVLTLPSDTPAPATDQGTRRSGSVGAILTAFLLHAPARRSLTLALLELFDVVAFADVRQKQEQLLVCTPSELPVLKRLYRAASVRGVLRCRDCLTAPHLLRLLHSLDALFQRQRTVMPTETTQALLDFVASLQAFVRSQAPPSLLAVIR